MNLGSKSESPPPRLKDRFKEATRTAILEAAEEVFARDGVERARIDAIAEHAGVSVGTIYNHIGDRDAVFGAVLAMRRHEIVEGVRAALDDTKADDARVQLERLARTLLEHVDRHRGFFAIVLESAEGPSRLAKPPETVAIFHEHVKTILKRGVRDGSLRADLTREHGVLFVGMVRAAIRERIRESGGPTAAAWARTITTLFLDGTAKRRSAR